MKSHYSFLASVFFIVATAVISCKPSGKDDDDTPPDNSFRIQNLSSMSALPTSLLIIQGEGFGETDQLWVRFADQADYSVDLPALQNNAGKLVVAVPAFVNATNGQFAEGEVTVQLIDKESVIERSSNVIKGFTVKNLPEVNTKAGMATLIFLTGQIKYLKMLQLEIANGVPANPDLVLALGTNLNQLEKLHNDLEKLVNTADPNTTYNFGTINGFDINISLSQLAQCDRFLLALYATLSDPNLSNPVSLVDTEKAILYNPCSEGAYNVTSDLGAGIDQGAVSNHMQCVASSLPDAINTAGNVIFGAGSVAIGFIALTALAAEIPVAAALALPAAAILYATIGTAGLEVVTGSAIANVNSQAAMQSIQQGVGRIEDMLRGIVTDQIFPDASGAFKSIIDGCTSLGEAFGNAIANTDCTYALAAYAVLIEANGGSGTVAVTTTDGCAWTAVSAAEWISITNGASGSGNGEVSFSALANGLTAERTGTIQVADKTFTVTQEANSIQPGPYDGTWTFSMTGTLVNDDVSIPYNMSSEMGIQGHDLIGWGDYGIGVLNDDGYAEWSTPENIFHYSGTFYSSGVGVGSWTYGPDGAGTTGAGTWNASRISGLGK